MKTAVEWLYEELYGVPRTLWEDQLLKIFEKAKEMEKEQIVDAFNEGENNSVDYFNPENRIKESEQYFNETFKK
jgi:hypothetical protein